MTDTSAETKPPLTKRDRKWMIHVAGINAATAAREKGADPEQTASLMDAAVFADGYPLGPHRLVYNGATVELMEKLTERYREAGETYGSSHLIFLLAEQHEAWLRLRTRAAFKIDDFEACVFSFMRCLTKEDLAEANQWFKEERDRVDGQREEAQLPQAQAGEPNS